MLSIEQRYNICLMAERYPKWTQHELALWAYKTFHLAKIPSQGTMSRLLAKRDVYMNYNHYADNGSKMRKPHNLLVRRVLKEWVAQCIWNGIPLSVSIIQDTAQAIWHKLPLEYRESNGFFSGKWAVSFLTSIGADISLLEQGLLKPPKVWTIEERPALKDFFSRIPPSDLFTLDETPLAYNLPLDYAEYEGSTGVQKKVDVATVMLCSNLEGSEKLKPLVIGRYNSYRSFRNYFPNEPFDFASQSRLGDKMALRFNITYHSNRRSWLTSSIFHNWLMKWDSQLATENRKIWLVLDDSCSHRIMAHQLKNIQLIYTVANSKFLPFNWGTLDEFKARYRIQQYRALIYLQRRLEGGNDRKALLGLRRSQITMSNAIKFIREAWSEIQPNSIRAHWKRSGILPAGAILLDNDMKMPFKRNEELVNELNFLCSEFYCIKKWQYDMLLNLNIETKTTNYLSTEDLIDSSMVDQCEPEPKVALFDKEANDIETAEEDIDSSNSYIKYNSITNDYNILESSGQLGLNIERLLNGNGSTVNIADPNSDFFNVSNLIDKPDYIFETTNKIHDGARNLSTPLDPMDYFTPEAAAEVSLGNDFMGEDISAINSNTIFSDLGNTNAQRSELSPEQKNSYGAGLSRQPTADSALAVSKTLEALLKLIVKQEISFSKATVNEIKYQYVMALKAVRSKLEQTLNDAKPFEEIDLASMERIIDSPSTFIGYGSSPESTLHTNR